MPWAAFCALVEPHYPKVGNGRPPVGRERVPDATTLLNFRHLLETHKLGEALFATVGELLLANGMKLSGGTIVEAALIAAPPSVKNQDKARDPVQKRIQPMLAMLNLVKWGRPLTGDVRPV